METIEQLEQVAAEHGWRIVESIAGVYQVRTLYKKGRKIVVQYQPFSRRGCLVKPFDIRNAYIETGQFTLFFNNDVINQIVKFIRRNDWSIKL